MSMIIVFFKGQARTFIDKEQSVLMTENNIVTEIERQKIRSFAILLIQLTDCE